MSVTQKDYEEVIGLGLKLVTKQDTDRLMASILDKGMEITGCDAATLYVCDGDFLRFKIMKTLSMNVNRGADGEDITDIPPVAMREENVCAYAALHRCVVNIPDVYHYEHFDFSGPREYDRLTGYHTRSMLVVSLVDPEEKTLGVLQMINAMDGEGNVIPFGKEYDIVIQGLGNIAAMALTSIRYLTETKRTFHSFVEAISSVVDEGIPYNETHTKNMAKYALLLTFKINEKHAAGEAEEYFDENRQEQLALAALLHDVGKVAVPRDVINRATRLSGELKTVESRFELLGCYYKIDLLQGRMDEEAYGKRMEELEQGLALVHRVDNATVLEDEDFNAVQALGEKFYEKEDGSRIPYLTDFERECLSIRRGTLTADMRRVVQQHVEGTKRILSKVYFSHNYEMVPKWAYEHHELLDGSGYPCHKTAEELPIESRILTVTDIYEALTASDRPYKKQMPEKEAIGILTDMAKEGKLDKRLVEWLGEIVL